MPMYLKRDAIRFIEASVSAISMAVAALGMPRRYDFREVAAENAVAIGLAGVAAELSMSAVIVQAQGEDALKFPTGFYKTGSHIVDDFKKLVGSQIPKMMFLTQGIEEPSAHIAKLLEMASKLKLLTKLRAGGLHAGRGPSMDVSIAWFPSYLVSEKGFSILKVGIWGMLPSIAAVFGGLIAGTITDKMISNGHSKTLSRKLPLCVGLICSGSIVFADSVHSGYLAVALLSFSFAMAIAASPSIWAIPGDIAPDSNLVGTIGGIQNTVSNIAGIVAPIITGYIIYKTGGFKVALLASGIISCIGAFSYIFVVGKLEAIDIGN